MYIGTTRNVVRQLMLHGVTDRSDVPGGDQLLDSERNLEQALAIQSENGYDENGHPQHPVVQSRLCRVMNLCTVM